MADRFPKDCWDKKCSHFHTRDLSIDDLVCTCDLLKIQCDACNDTRISKEGGEGDEKVY